MSDDWYRDLDNKMICGAVLLDFTAAFDVIEHNLLEKLVCYGFKQSAATWMESYLVDRSQSFLMEVTRTMCWWTVEFHREAAYTH